MNDRKKILAGLKQQRLQVRHALGIEVAKIAEQLILTRARFDDQLSQIDAEVERIKAGGASSAPAPMPAAQRAQPNPPPEINPNQLQRGQFVISPA